MATATIEINPKAVVFLREPKQEVTLGSQFGAMSQLVKPRIKTDDGIFGLEKMAETIGPVPPCRRIECSRLLLSPKCFGRVTVIQPIERAAVGIHSEYSPRTLRIFQIWTGSILSLQNRDRDRRAVAMAIRKAAKASSGPA